MVVSWSRFVNTRACSCCGLVLPGKVWRRDFDAGLMDSTVIGR